MPIRNPYPGELYRAEDGTVWQVVGTWYKPTVMVERLERLDANRSRGHASQLYGGIDAPMWDGFKKLVPEG